MAIPIAHKTPVTVLISKIFLGISAVPIMMLFRETADHMLAVNVAVKRPVVVSLAAVHIGCMAVVEDNRYHKLILTGLAPAVEDVSAEFAVQRMPLDLEEERIDS